MKDIDILLTKNKIKPQRLLREDFTKNITNHLDEHPHKTRLSYIKELLFMKLFTKPAIAVLAIVALVTTGGTAYAAVGGWPGIEALFSGQKKVDNARIVKVDTKNCTITSAFNITAKDKRQDTYYYKVINNSKLTNEQIVQMVRGYCEIGASGQASLNIKAELEKNPPNKDSMVGGYIDSVVTAISNSSISIESKMPIGDDVKTVKQTFSHIDPQVIVQGGGRRLSLSDIKAGDHVSITYRASGEALRNSETISPDKINTDEQVIVAISKNSKDLTASINYQKYNGKEFEQVVPCAEDATGYCTIEQYMSK